MTPGTSGSKKSEKKHKPEEHSKASSRGDWGMVDEILRDYPSEIPESVLANSLKWAGYYGHLEIMKRLLRAGANPNYIFHDGPGADRGPDMNVVQWLEFNLERCGRIGCVGWEKDSESKVSRAIELLKNRNNPN